MRTITLDLPVLSEEEVIAYNGLNTAMDLAHRTAVNAGWYYNLTTGQEIKRNFGEVLALMHSELSEALEAHRKSLKSDKLPNAMGEEEEFADCIIRIFDTARANGYDVAGAFILKNRFNQSREDHKLANRAQPGGKKF